MNRTISVIVPVYNVAQYLPACLDSILSQDYEALEVILIDDGSTICPVKSVTAMGRGTAGCG